MARGANTRETRDPAASQVRPCPSASDCPLFALLKIIIVDSSPRICRTLCSKGRKLAIVTRVRHAARAIGGLQSHWRPLRPRISLHITLYVTRCDNRRFTHAPRARNVHFHTLLNRMSCDTRAKTFFKTCAVAVYVEKSFITLVS